MKGTLTFTGVKLGHMKNALFGISIVAKDTTQKSVFFVCIGHMKNAFFGVV